MNRSAAESVAEAHLWTGLEVCGVGKLSEEARARLLSIAGEPLFLADWDAVLMIHFEVDAHRLQKVVPFELELWEQRAFVSVVAFTMRRMRPRLGGSVAAWLFKAIATHPFLNVRTYVRHKNEQGVYFLAEWLCNRLSVLLGPRIFGLPYRLGTLQYNHTSTHGRALNGRVTDQRGSALAYECVLDDRSQECESGSHTAWLMERYTAFTCIGQHRRFFRVWHPPWQLVRANVQLRDATLLQTHWPFFCESRLVGSNYSSGLRDVWMGRPQCLKE